MYKLILTSCLLLIPAYSHASIAQPVPVLWKIDITHRADYNSLANRDFVYASDSAATDGLVSSWEWESTIDHSLTGGASGSSKIKATLRNDRVIIDYDTTITYFNEIRDGSNSTIFWLDSDIYLNVQPHAPLWDTLNVQVEHIIFDREGNYRVDFDSNLKRNSGSDAGNVTYEGRAGDYPPLRDRSIVVDGTEYAREFGSFNWGADSPYIEESGVFVGESSTIRGRFIYSAENKSRPIPEPASATLLGIGLISLLQIRRRIQCQTSLVAAFAFVMVFAVGGASASTVQPVLWDIQINGLSSHSTVAIGEEQIKTGSQTSGLVQEWSFQEIVGYDQFSAIFTSSEIIAELEGNQVVIDYERTATYVAAPGGGFRKNDQGLRIFAGLEQLTINAEPYAPTGDLLDVMTEVVGFESSNARYTFGSVFRGQQFNTTGNFSANSQFTTVGGGVNVDGTIYSRERFGGQHRLIVEDISLGPGESVSNRGRYTANAMNLSVPEPATAAFLGLGCAALLRRDT